MVDLLGRDVVAWLYVYIYYLFGVWEWEWNGWDDTE